MNAFLAELRRRKVIRVAAAYLVAAWVIMQVVNVATPALELPGWVDGFIFVLLAAGFVIVVVLSWVFELTPEGIKATAPAAVSAPSAPLAKTDVVLIGAVAVLIGVSLFQVARPASQRAAPADVAAPAVAETAVLPDARVSLAVLPFADMSPQGDQEYFSDGLSEEILNQLAQLDGLRVIARNSSFVFKGRNVDMREAGEALGVANLLEGSVRKDGDRLRITAQLIAAADGSHLWSQTYDRQLADVFAVQEEIARAVAGALSVRLGVSALSRAGGTRNVEAYEAYLRAQQVGSVAGPDAVSGSIENLRRAVALDPGFARAWAELAFVQGLGLSDPPSPEGRRLAAEEVERAASRAVALAPEMWESQAALGWAHVSHRRWLEAEAAFAQARSLADRAGVVPEGLYGWHLLDTGRAERLFDVLEEARRLDPLARGLAAAIENAEFIVGRRAEPSSQFDNLSFDLRVDDALARHDADALRQAVAPLLAAAGGFSIPISAEETATFEIFGRVSSGEIGFEALAEEARALEARATSPFKPQIYRVLARMAAAAGDAGYAVELLRKSYLAEPVSTFHFYMWFPVFAEARATEDFKALVRDLGLVELWRTTGDWGDFCRPLGDDDFACG
jgi:TolB-like protein